MCEIVLTAPALVPGVASDGHHRACYASVPMSRTAITGVSLAVQFAAELVVLAALAVWGHGAVDGIGRYALMVAAPAVAAVVWGVFGAPRGPRHLTGLGRRVLQVVWFGAGALALGAAFAPVAGLIFALVVAANIAFLTRAGRD
jgi:hypothetical protein